MSYLSKDSLAIVLLSSNLGLNPKETNYVKPFTLQQWNKLTVRLIQSSLQRPQAFFETTPEIWQKELYLKEDEVERLKKLLARAGQVGIEIEQLQSQGIYITTRAEENYPQQLKKVLKHNSPSLLYWAGDMNLVNNPSVAVVGSRNPEQKALDFTKNLAVKSVKSGMSIVSGGAKGIDSTAQENALKSGGYVISILSDGLARKLRYKKVREYIMRGKLLLLSAVHPKSGFTVYSAMNRNKYIYGLSDVAVVVSSDENKGGTWAGATENLKNKWVPLFVRSEEGIPKGNENLLAMGCKPISSADLLSTSDLQAWFQQHSGAFYPKLETEQVTMLELLRAKDESVVYET